MEGFICNKQSHWFAIRKINGRYWNLNSTADRPEAISHFNVATELDKLINDGYSVFCVAVDKPLPPACGSVQEMERRRDRQYGGVKGNWSRESDLLKGSSAGGQNGSAGGDPWKNVGSGMRLDGRAPAAAAASESLAASEQDWTNALTEEEQLQMVIAASLETPMAVDAPAAAAAAASIPSVPVPPEPAAGTPGAVRIQFRLPSHRRIVR